MSDGIAQLVTIPLRNGGEVRVGPDGLRIRDALYTLASIQDARQVSPEPETVALRVAGTGLVEFQPARAGDGAVALEALFRLRPELRPAGFAPVLSVDLPPLPATSYVPPEARLPAQGRMGQQAGTMTQRIPVPPEVASAYGPQPNRGRAELTPYPRSFGELVGVVFRLYGKHLGVWLALAFVVVLLPAVVMGGLAVAIDMLRGVDPLAGRDALGQLLGGADGAASASPAALPAYYELLTSLHFMLGLALDAWTLAALTIASRDALLGRRLSLRSSIGGGFSRLWRTLSATLLVILMVVVLSLPALFLAAVVAEVLSGIIVAVTGAAVASGTDLTPLGFVVAVIAMLIAFLPVLALGVRLGLAPSLAALGYNDPIRRSLLLTRRHWWRTFGVLLLANIPLLIALLTELAAEYVSVGLASVVVRPLVLYFVAPLSALALTALIYDLRLRHEGYFVFMQEQVTPIPGKTMG